MILLTPAGLVLAAAPLAMWLGLRWRHGRRIERECDGRHRRGPDGVIAGAESITLEGDARGALLLHGFGDTPQSLERLAAHLHRRGWSVRVPLLPGHGRTLKEFVETGRGEWYEAAVEAYDGLRHRSAGVAIVGQSMGGALAVRLAAARPDVWALVLLAPYLSMRPGIARLARFHAAAGIVTPYLRTRTDASIRDVAARSRSLGYGFASARQLRDLLHLIHEARLAAPAVRAPTLMMQSRQDNRIAPDGAEAAFAEFAAEPRELVWIDESGHVLSVDYGCERVFALTSDWLERFAPAATDPSAPAIPRSA